MKLNFWQWLGVILLIAGAVMVTQRYIRSTDPSATTAPAAP